MDNSFAVCSTAAANVIEESAAGQAVFMLNL
jgi:hypothetical protein